MFTGDELCGKTSLMNRLRQPGEEDLHRGAGIEYTYLDVDDDERDGMDSF